MWSSSDGGLKRSIFAVAFFIALLLQAATFSDRINAQQESRFLGIAIEYFKGGLGGPFGWRVRVIDVISGPQLEGYTVEVYSQSVPPPKGSMDPEIEAGDAVEACGLHTLDSGGKHRVSLLGSDNYYLKKVVLAVGGTLVPVNKLAVTTPYLASAAVIVALSAVVVIKRRKR